MIFYDPYEIPDPPTDPESRPDPRNQLRGVQNRQQGQIFERMIDYSCEEYQRDGVAYIEKTPEPMKVLRSIGKGSFHAVFTASAQPDYKGTLQGGRAVCFEAKSATGDKIAQDRVTPPQLKALELHEALGAQVFILACLDFCLFCRVPLGVWRTMKERYNHKHMTKRELEPFRVPFRDGRMLFLQENSGEGSGK